MRVEKLLAHTAKIHAIRATEVVVPFARSSAPDHWVRMQQHWTVDRVIYNKRQEIWCRNTAISAVAARWKSLCIEVMLQKHSTIQSIEPYIANPAHKRYTSPGHSQFVVSIFLSLPSHLPCQAEHSNTLHTENFSRVPCLELWNLMFI